MEEEILTSQEEISRKPVTPLGEFNCQSYPLVKENTYLISDEELEKLGRHELKWSKGENGEPILVENDPTEENERNLALKRIAELKKLLADTDYMAIKHSEGLISDADYEAIKAERQGWRDEINELEERLKAVE